MAPRMEPPSTITLRIKVPPGHIEGGADEFTLGTDIPIASRIGHIRGRIQEAIPSRPTPERQRLLHAGRALVDNEQTLADALHVTRDPTQTEYVMHLLVKGEGSGTAPVPHRRGVSISAGPTANMPAAGTGLGDPPHHPPPQTQPPLPPQAQPPLPQHPHPHPHPQHVPPQHITQHQAVAFAQQQQQRLQAILMQNAGQNPFIPHMMGFPQQQQHQHQQQYQQQQHGMPGVPGVAFQQAVGQRQQQRAGMGMQGLGPQNGQQGNATGQTEAQPNRPAHTDGAAEQNPGQPQVQQAQPQANAGQTPAIPNPPHRPLSGTGFHVEGVAPNGDRFTIHQQTLSFPLGMPGQAPVAQQMQPPHIPGFGLPPAGLPPLPGTLLQNQPSANVPTALERARENLAEMRRMLAELQSAELTPEAHTASVRRLEEQARYLNDYIDPMRLGNLANNRARSNLSQYPQLPASLRNTQGAAIRSTSQPPLGAIPSWQQRAGEMRQQNQHQQYPNVNSSGSDVTCYLLSSPTGPHAILYTPQHGAFTGALPRQTVQHEAFPLPVDTIAQTIAPEGQAQQHNQFGQAAPAQQAPARAPAREPDPLGPLGPILGHMWLLLRIMIFSYFLLGANMGWRRPLALATIGLGFWMIRAGLLGNGGAARRWWDGIMNENRLAQAEGHAQQQAVQQQQGQAQEGREVQPRAADNARPGQMPTPGQVAQRLLNENARIRNERFHWLREQVRPVERAVALLVASLWPGVGEAYVRAREQEERRRVEAEIAAKRAEEEREEERQRLKDQGKAAEEGPASPTSAEDAEAKEKPEVVGEAGPDVSAPEQDLRDAGRR